MKKLKLMMAIIAILVFSNLLFAAKPLTNDDNNLASQMVNKLDKSVILTDSQRVVILQNVKTFILKTQNIDTSLSDNEKFKLKKQASDDYEAFLDNILTKGQKETLEMKIQATQDSIMKQFESKKNN